MAQCHQVADCGGVTCNAALSRCTLRKSTTLSASTRSEISYLKSECDASGGVNGDPHFHGFDGSRFDFQGNGGGVFNIITEKHFQLNSRFIEAEDSNTYMGALGVRLADHTIMISPDLVEIDERVVGKAQSVALQTKDGNPAGEFLNLGANMILKTPFFDLHILKASHKGTRYLNIECSVVSHAVDPHGILGQTAIFLANGMDPHPKILSHKNKFATGLLEGQPADYLVSDGLFGTDFTFNRYGVKREAPQGRKFTGVVAKISGPNFHQPSA